MPTGWHELSQRLAKIWLQMEAGLRSPQGILHQVQPGRLRPPWDRQAPVTPIRRLPGGSLVRISVSEQVCGSWDVHLGVISLGGCSGSVLQGSTDPDARRGLQVAPHPGSCGQLGCGPPSDGTAEQPTGGSLVRWLGG